MDEKGVRKPLPIRLLNRYAEKRIARGKDFAPLKKNLLMEAAVKKTGLDDFGSLEYEEGLERLIESLNNDSNLSGLGRLMARETVTQMLRHRLRIEDHLKTHPEIASERIEKPVFIIGPPRSGTSITHNLLSQDPNNRYPMVWETFELWPPVNVDTMYSDPRIRVSEKNYRQVNKLSPQLASAHSLDPWDAQECVLFQSVDFHSYQFFVMFNCTGYQEWLVDQKAAWQWPKHKTMLQYLQSGGLRKERWLLKSPAHLSRIQEILEVYPDACIIQTHRDPVVSVTSMASLSTMLQQITVSDLDLKQVGTIHRELIKHLLDENVRQRKELDRAGLGHRFIDIYMNDLVTDPLNVVDQIYKHFQIPLNTKTRRAMADYMTEHSLAKKKPHRYSHADFGIVPERDRDLFKDYIEFFDVPVSKGD